MHLRSSIAPILVFAFLGPAACTETSEPATVTTPAVARASETIILGVEGMHCDGCVNAVTTKVSKVDGVESCEVSLEDGTATVVADPASFDEVQGAIAKLGYTVNATPR